MAQKKTCVFFSPVVSEASVVLKKHAKQHVHLSSHVCMDKKPMFVEIHMFIHVSYIMFIDVYIL